MQAIADAGLAFNIQEQQLNALYNMNQQLQFNANHTTRKADDLTAEILVRSFGVTAETMISGQTIAARYIQHTIPDRLVKTLTKLLELELIPNNLNDIASIQVGIGANGIGGNGVVVAHVQNNLVDMIARKITSVNFSKVLNLLRDKAGVERLGADMLTPRPR